EDDRQLDRTETLPTRFDRGDQPEIAHLGEAGPLRRVVGAGTVLDQTARTLERELGGQEIARRAAQQRLVVGQLEAHHASCGRLSTRLPMMFFWISDDPE